MLRIFSGIECKVRQPVTLDCILNRLEPELRKQGRTLCAVYCDRHSISEPVQFDVFEVELKDLGTVRKIDLVTRGRELGVIGRTESPQPTWS